MPQALKNQRCYTLGGSFHTNIIKVAQEREDSQRVWFPINETIIRCVECVLGSLIWADIPMHFFDGVCVAVSQDTSR